MIEQILNTHKEAFEKAMNHFCTSCPACGPAGEPRVA